MKKRLVRSRNRLIFGVCSGLAEYFGIDPMIVRLISIILFFGFGVGLIAYLVLALIMPNE